MAAQHNVLLVSKDPETIAAVSDVLGADGQFGLAGACDTLAGLVTHLERSGTPAVLVDIDPEQGRILQELAPIVARFPDARFVVLSSASRNELLVEAMQAGARYFLVKTSIEAELPSALRRLVPEGHAGAPGRGTVVAVLSASGGCGATTLAVNLANELGLEAGEAALLIDMDVSYGAVAPYLGMKGEYGIADVLAYGGQVDGHLVRTSAVECSEALHVLLSPIAINFSQPRPMRFEALPSVLQACKSAYPYVVIDAPRVPMETAATLARASDIVFIVFQLTVKDVHVARSVVSALIDHGVARELVLPLASRYHRGSPVGLKEAREALGDTEIARVRNDFRSAARGLSYGQPLAKAARRSVVRKDIRRLALDLVKKEPGSQTRRSR